jgi:hypothetical protein
MVCAWLGVGVVLRPTRTLLIFPDTEVTILMLPVTWSGVKAAKAFPEKTRVVAAAMKAVGNFIVERRTLGVRYEFDVGLD